MKHYVAFGLRIDSDLPLPELPQVEPFADPDLTIRTEALPAVGAVSRFGEDEVSLNIDKVARYRIRRGREIAIDPYPGASERGIRLFLLGRAFGVLCFQRGLLPLHATVIVVNGVAMGFAGRSGIGKSTLAAHFLSRGYDVLSDDVCVVGFDAGHRPVVRSGVPQLKLWRDAADNFGYDRQRLTPTADGIEKYYVPMTGFPQQNAFSLSRLYILSDIPPGATGGIFPLTGLDALLAIITNTYRREYLREMGLSGANLAQAERLAQFTKILAAPRERGFNVFAREAARLEAHVLQPDTNAFGDTGRDLPARSRTAAGSTSTAIGVYGI